MVDVTAYNMPSITTCTVDFRDWHLVQLHSWRDGQIRRWMHQHSKGLISGVLYKGFGVIRFQQEEDLMFFKISFNHA